MNRDWIIICTQSSGDRGWSPLVEWCYDKFGFMSSVYNWNYLGEGVFEFKYEQDAVLFALRWG